MAWQSPSAHNLQDGNGQGGPGGNGGAGGGLGVGANGSAVAGTEYTLQGVMRFLQTEWHRHERDRNSWEIERAEMKARIAQLEGDHKTSKRMLQGSEARIKMLEIALKRERGMKIEGSDLPGDTGSGKAGLANSVLPSKSEVPPAMKNDEIRGKNKGYLSSSVHEITYLLSPPSHPAPQQQPNIPSEQGQNNKQGNLQTLEQILAAQHNQNALSQGSISNAQNQINDQEKQRQQLHQQKMRDQQQLSHRNAKVQPGPADGEQLPHGYQPPVDSYENENKSGGSLSRSQSTGSNSSYSSSSSDNKDADAWDFDEVSEVPSFNKNNSQIAADSDQWGSRAGYSSVKNGNMRIGSRGRKNSMSRRMSAQEARDYAGSISGSKSGGDAGNFKVRFALRGHLDVVRAVVFTGGGSPAEPEICTAGDDGVLKRWTLPGTFGIHAGVDVDVQSTFTHRGHVGVVTCLAACPPIDNSGNGDGWIFSGGQDATIKVWERGRVEAKATLVGHTDVIWALCVLPAPSGGDAASERMLLASGSADGTVKIWSFTPKPPSSSPASASNSIRGPAYMQNAHDYMNKLNSSSPFAYTLLTTISRPNAIASPTCICPLSITGENFIVSYNDAAVIIYDTQTGEEIATMASTETYDGTPATGVNAVVATTVSSPDASVHGGMEEEKVLPGATGLRGGVYGVVISGHEDRYVRFYDANSGQCTYTMLAHPAAIASLALSPDGRELVSGGHDASLRFWSMEKRSCIKELTTHRLMRGEGVCTVIWSADGRWVVSGGGDGVVKVYSR